MVTPRVLLIHVNNFCLVVTNFKVSFNNAADKHIRNSVHNHNANSFIAVKQKLNNFD